MSDEAKNQEMELDEAQIPPETVSPENASDKAKKKPRRRKRRIWFLLLMLVVLAGLTALAYWYLILHPGKFNLSSLPGLTALRNDIEHPTTTAPQAAQSPKAASSTHNAEATPPVTLPKALVPTVQTPLGSQQAAQLMAAIQQLQSQLQQMRGDNEQLRRALDQQQRLDLRSRLRLIADPATRLEQLALLWQDISLSPAISADQRNEAVSMTAAAREALTQNQQWQQRLDQWIVRLSGSDSGPDMIPHSDHPWLAWLGEQFHLRPAPTNSNGSQVLRQKLIRIRRGMSIESWPEAKDWRPIRAELILINASSAKSNSNPTALGLPNNFTAMSKAVAALHATARQWLEANP